MGREIKILLAFLGLLAGAFLGVVSTKLFVPRPPDGAGPDVHAEFDAAEAQSLVEPPDFAQPPALAAAMSGTPPTPPQAAPTQLDGDPYASRTSRFNGGDTAADMPHDSYVSRASFDTAALPPANPAEDLLSPPAETITSELSPPQGLDEPAFLPVSPPAAGEPVAAPPSFDEAPAFAAPPALDAVSFSAPPPAAAGDTHVAGPGDSWWSLAERAYGDGRLYRALFAWNRAVNPRVSLVPGTSLEIPPATKLAAAWPSLMPRD